MMGADLETSTEDERERLAAIVNLSLVASVAGAIEKVSEHLPAPPQVVIGSGSGEFLLPMINRCPTGQGLAGIPIVSLTQRLGSAISASACAYAVAVLCAEQEG
jgi:uncharacterized hydantoinase/oxoprolinase family protein